MKKDIEGVYSYAKQAYAAWMYDDYLIDLEPLPDV